MPHPLRTRRPSRHALLPLAWLACLACQANAQDKPTNAAATLREVVVSGSRSEQLGDELPVSLDVVNQQEAEFSQMQDIRDAVRDLPNLSVPRGPSRFAITGPARSTGRDGNAGFQIRGLGGNRVLMLVDGVRVPHSYIFGSNAFGRDYLSMDLLKRLEVLRGPSSALYGSDGLAGLVNLITHEPADFLHSSTGEAKSLGGRISTAWSGDDRGRGLSATVAGRASDSVQWLLTASGHRAHGLQTRGDIDTPDTRRTTANPQHDRDTALLGKLVFQPDGWQKHVFTLEQVDKESSVNLLSSRAPLPLGGTPAQQAAAVMDERAESTSTRQRLTWDARYQINTALANEVRTVLGVQRASARQLGTSDLYHNPDRVRDVFYEETTWQAGIQASQSTSLDNGWARKLTYGLDYQSADLSNLYTGVNPLPPEVFPLKRFPDTRESGSALYAQSEWMNERWSIVPGVRLDWFAVDVRTQEGFYPPAKRPARSLSGSAVSPKLGVMYQVRPGWSLFGNYAGGFRAPSAYQVNGYYENLAEHVVIAPNPDLRPEKSRNLELGLRTRLNRLQADVAVFSGRFSQLIQEQRFISGAGTLADPKVFQTVNIDQARIHGFEVKGHYDWGLWAGGRWGTPFSYGQARGKNTLTGTPLSSVEPAKLSLGLDYQTATWSTRLVVRHHAAKRAQDIDSSETVKAPKVQITVPAATTLDWFAQWRLRKNVRLNVGIVNLTNRKYWMWSDVRGLESSSTVADAYTQPGRSAQLSLVVDF